MTTEKKSLTTQGLSNLVEKWVAEGKTVLAPVIQDNRVEFAPISSLPEMTSDYIRTVKPAKFAVFPRVEKLLEFRREGKEVIQSNPDTSLIPETIVLGLRPCDAAGFASLKAIFTWEYTDTIFTTRLSRTTLIGVSCTQSDDYCFCTSVNGGPGNVQGCDILLTKAGENSFLAEIVTEKGEKIVNDSRDFGDPPACDKETLLTDVHVKFSLQEIEQRTSRIFEMESLWIEQSLRCIGCGSCAFVCPTCACFDIQDEGSQNKGYRVRCWDSCGFSLFTLHTSGHNPREVQSQRWRQRIMHKFAYMPERQQVIGCVGCGRCSASCPVDMNISEHLKNIAEVQL